MKVIFFEKPGCINNTKQKALLAEHNVEVEAKSLLTEQWTKESLRPFFGNLPINKWFNSTAPSIKNGSISPSDFDEESAIEAMLKEPLLIRRPLVVIDGHRVCGFDHPKVQKLINNIDTSELLVCPQQNNKCD
ncbi:ArsC/Spx/MgsR family protein [Saccharicrinis aurantiacus]|uniref:ArsC/Spx/MgsR family protein n=1 Tax=Saccharicrinis aurantiacus TaxID=1849719 RepID=UPI0024939A56|nr:ArsC/Spx/MgsR family protein [Saccharicrinis aurantiacus]